MQKQTQKAPYVSRFNGINRLFVIGYKWCTWCNLLQQLVDKIGPLEYIFNTPSHHRVHHGRNPYCIDKNYAGVLIIWDRIFGNVFCSTHPWNGLTLSLPVNPFAARGFVLLMQSLQRRVSQRDSAIPKRSFCSALVLLSMHKKPEVQQVVLSHLTGRYKTHCQGRHQMS